MHLALFELLQKYNRKKREVSMQTSPNTGPGPILMSAGTLVGDTVKNREGEELGKIEEIMLDTYTGNIGYAVLSFGGLFGLGDKLFAIPWNAMEIDTSNKCVVLNLDKSRLKEAPGFDKGNWPNMADLTWSRDLHNFYGSPAYWDR